MCGRAGTFPVSLGVPRRQIASTGLVLQERSASKPLLVRSNVGIPPILSDATVVACGRMESDGNEIAPVVSDSFGVPGLDVQPKPRVIVSTSVRYAVVAYDSHTFRNS